MKTNYLKQLAIPVILLTLLSSCAVVGGIFKTGMGFGVIAVIAVLVVIVFLFTRTRKK